VHDRYYFDPALCEYVNARDYYYDPETDLCFITCDQVVNSFSPEDVVKQLDGQEASPHTSELIELLITSSTSGRTSLHRGRPDRELLPA